MRLALSLLLLLPLAACRDDDPSPEDAVAQVAATPTESSTPGPSPTPAVNPNTPEATGLRWRIWNHRHTDVDGDGTLEDLGFGMSYGPIRITTILSGTGERITLQGSYGGLDWWPTGFPDLDNDGQREIVLSRGEGSQQRAVVVRLVDSDRFEIVKHRDKKPLVYGPTVAPGPGLAHDNDWFVRKGRLVSYRSLEGYLLESHSWDVPDKYAVRQWSWSLEGDHLRATDEGYWCKDESSEYPAPCGSVLPVLLPAVDDRLPADRFPGELPPSECGPYGVSPVRIPGGPGGSSGWLVLGPGCAESSAYEVYVDADGAWVAADHPRLPVLGGGVWDGDQGLEEFSTWVTAEGRLFSRRGPFDGAQKRVWEWTLDGTELHPTELGTVCFDPVTGPGRYGSC